MDAPVNVIYCAKCFQREEWRKNVFWFYSAFFARNQEEKGIDNGVTSKQIKIYSSEFDQYKLKIKCAKCRTPTKRRSKYLQKPNTRGHCIPGVHHFPMYCIPYTQTIIQSIPIPPTPFPLSTAGQFYIFSFFLFYLVICLYCNTPFFSKNQIMFFQAQCSYFSPKFCVCS